MHSQMSSQVNLKPLFHPRAVAVIGASETPGKVGRIILERLLSHGRTVYPVHPRAGTLLGLPVFSEVSLLPEDVDLAVIALGAEPATEAAEACARKGIPFIVPVAGGFSETGDKGKELEKRLASLPQKYGSRLLGPNTTGVRHAGEGGPVLDTVFIRVTDRYLAEDKGVAFISQSGSVASGSLEYAGNTGFSLRALVALGNKCDLTETDFVDYFAEDDKATCLALYLESLDGKKAFFERLKRAALRKPVVMLKAGRTPSAAAAVSSHTGKLAGSDNIINGACRQFGIVRACNELELTDAAKTLSMVPPPRGIRVGMVTCAGGSGVMACDMIETPARGVRLELAEFLPETVRRVREATFPFVSRRNPLDITPSHTEEMLLRALDAVLADPGVDMVISTAYFTTPFMSPGIIPALAQRATSQDKPLIVLSRGGPDTDNNLALMHRHGLVAFPTVERVVNALRCLVERSRFLGLIPPDSQRLRRSSASGAATSGATN